MIKADLTAEAHPAFAAQHSLPPGAVETVRASRRILAEHGNMSSPTVWFVLRELEKQGIDPGEWCIMVGFGAGLSAHAFLLKKK